MSKQKNVPIIVGVGQVVDHWDGRDPSQAPSPICLATQSIERALADTGNSDLHNDMDTLAVVRSFTDSLRSPFDPFGKAANFPAAIAQAAEIKPQQIIYSHQLEASSLSLWLMNCPKPLQMAISARQ